MTRRAVMMVLLGLGVLAAALGITRLRFDPNILGMLPQEMPEVRGLTVFHDAFSKEDEALANVATAMEGEDLAMRAHDPFRFLRNPALEPLLADAASHWVRH